MSTSSQRPFPPARPQVAEPVARRPLPAGVVGLPAAERGARPERQDKAPSGTLLVGQGIQIKGQIESCDILVVEGQVDASLVGEALEVLRDGLFKGTAEVERAEVAGRVEGSLTVRDHLVIKPTGRVAGTIRYAQISIEKGGEISGDVQAGTAEALAEPEAAGHVA